MNFPLKMMVIITLSQTALIFSEDEKIISYGSYADENYRDKHQWKGRNAGGWRHGNWYGGVDENEPDRENEAYIWYYDMNAEPPPRIDMPNQEEELDEESSELYEEGPEKGHGVYIGPK